MTSAMTFGSGSALGAAIVVVGLVLSCGAEGASLILYEDFEEGTMDSRISVETVGTFISEPGIKDVTQLGSTKAFGYGRSTCPASCFDGYVTNFRVTLGESAFVTTISFKEMELYDNWGSKGKIYIDGNPISWGDYNENEDFGRQPTNDRQPDTAFRTPVISVDEYVTTIELKVADITNLSEIFIDDLEILGPAGSLSTLWIGEAIEECPSDIIFPVYVSTVEDILAIEFSFAYPADLVWCSGVDVGGLASSFVCLHIIPQDGQLRVAMVGMSGFTGEGLIANLGFTVDEPWPSGICRTFVLYDYIFNEGDPPSGAPDSLTHCFSFGPSHAQPTTWSHIKAEWR
jgi:hypothetical protein